MKVDLSRYTRNKKLHSKEHVLADDLSSQMQEPKRFAAYLGIARLYHESDLRALSRYILEKENLPADARGKYFFAAIKGFSKKYQILIKGKKKKRKKKVTRRKPK